MRYLTAIAVNYLLWKVISFGYPDQQFNSDKFMLTTTASIVYINYRASKVPPKPPENKSKII